MTWALKRQILYIIILLLVFSIFGFLIVRSYFDVTPTCMDNKQNGGELGVDCGGACVRACIFQVEEVSVLWARAFKIIPGRYNALAYIDNHNKNIAVNKINYKFRFADKNNIYIGKREGTAFIPPFGKFAIFEPAIEMGNSVPIYTTFEFTQVPDWISVSEEKVNKAKIFVSDVVLLNEATNPVLTLSVENRSLSSIPDVYVVAILYDENNNAVSVSRTYLDELVREEKKNIVFTWPEAFTSKIITKEIIPMYNIFDLK